MVVVVVVEVRQNKTATLAYSVIVFRVDSGSVEVSLRICVGLALAFEHRGKRAPVPLHVLHSRIHS